MTEHSPDRPVNRRLVVHVCTPNADPGGGCLTEGAEQAGSDVDDNSIRLIVPLGVDEDSDEARTAAVRFVSHLRDFPGYYDSVAGEAGLEADVEAINREDTTTEAVTEISDEFVDATTLATTPSDARERLWTFITSGRREHQPFYSNLRP